MAALLSLSKEEPSQPAEEAQFTRLDPFVRHPELLITRLVITNPQTINSWFRRYIMDKRL